MSDSALAFSEHDHRPCRDGALERLGEHAQNRGLRLTPQRRRVFEVLAEAHRALGAYEILERLSGEGMAQQPPSVYRALDFLMGEGFVHRIEKLNAFVACCRPGDGAHAAGGACFLICGGCRKVAEIEDDDLAMAIAGAAAAQGFAIERAVVELGGTCPACRATR